MVTAALPGADWRAFAAIATMVGATLTGPWSEWPARASAVAQNEATPPYLRVLAATIAEGPPFEAAAIANREVRFRLAIAGAPPCGAGQPDVAYDFLIDGRPWQRRGVILHSVPEIQPGARLSLSCDRVSGRFVSSIPGVVTVGPSDDAPAAYALEVRTRLGELPAVEFAWVAMAREGDRFTRLPEAGSFGVWRIYERALK